MVTGGGDAAAHPPDDPGNDRDRLVWPGPGWTAGPPGASLGAEAETSRLERILAWAGPALIVFLVSIMLDALTIMPGLGYWDTAEFQALGPVLGIAHPTGYPSYTLLLWLASVVLQPFGEPAFRANLLSALLVSGAAALTAVAILQLTRRPALAIAGGVALAVSPIAWRNALRADPHAFQVFLVGLLLVTLIAWARRERQGARGAGRWLVMASAVFALAVTNHGLTLALAPGVAVYVLLVQPRILRRRARTVLACLGTLVLLTVALYAYLPIRSSMDPPLNYARPSTWVRTNPQGRVTGGFRYLVLGEQFGGKVEMPPLPQWPSLLPGRLADGAGIAARTLQDELGLPVAALAVLGIPLGLVRRPREVVMTALWFALTFMLALGYPNADISRYYLAPLLVACVWAALAADALWRFASLALRRLAALAPSAAEGRAAAAGRGDRLLGAALTAVASVVLLLPIAAEIPRRYARLDASDEIGARRWLDATLDVVEPDAVIVSWWSYSTPLWYGQYVEGRRPDVLVIDDRTIVDNDWGNVPAVVERYFGQRPVYVVRLDRDLAEVEKRWELEAVVGVPLGEPVYRVIDDRGGAARSV